jgi:ubiquinone/menaquinone biosynthesis C-methylase UbiE
MKNTRDEFWKSRSRQYEKLDWAIRGGYLHSFLDAGDFNADDYVLDIGTGTGIIAHTIAPFVDKVVGIDISGDMLEHAFQHRTEKEEFLKMDATNIEFRDGIFTKVTARMVFHHIMENTQKAMDECYRVLKKGGKMVFSEGVPPTEHVKPFYVEMFKYKEERITFMESDLEKLMKNAGFRIAKKVIHWNKRSSIRNWLENSGLERTTQDHIFRMHLDLDEQGKKDYNMALADDDCFIDMRFVILVGEK